MPDNTAAKKDKSMLGMAMRILSGSEHGKSASMGMDNPQNDEALCASGDDAACQRIQNRQKTAMSKEKAPQGKGTQELSK